MTDAVMYLSEVQERILDYDIVTCGYIRNIIKLKIKKLPKEIINECIKFTAPLKLTDEREDPCNWITENDKNICNAYKQEGNEFFKAKDYEAAITKYTTALRYNPNNHLIYSNRAFCHYLTANYEQAKDEIAQCVNIRPTFSKGWYRYGCILENLQKYGMAAIAYRSAYKLSVNFKKQNEQNQATNAYKIHFDKLLKFLHDNEALDDIKYIEEFDKHSEGHWKTSFDDLMTKKLAEHPELERMRDSKNEEERALYLQRLEEIITNTTEFMDKKNENDFRANVEQSKCHWFASTNKFKFGQMDDPSCPGMHFWEIGWTSTPQIDCNKRIFCVNICAHQGMVVNSWMQHGIPDEEQIIYTILRTITFANMVTTQGIKPQAMRVCYRKKDQFDAIAKAMKKFGIFCLLQTEKQNEMACRQHETNIDGWNHL